MEIRKAIKAQDLPLMIGIHDYSANSTPSGWGIAFLFLVNGTTSGTILRAAYANPAETLKDE